MRVSLLWSASFAASPRRAYQRPAEAGWLVQYPHRDPSTTDPSYRSGLRRSRDYHALGADFCPAVRTPHDALSHVFVTHSRSPVISSTAFHAQPPDLPPVSLMDTGFAIIGSLARHRRPHHPVLVHRLACLLHASFRPHLAVTPLRFATLHLHQVGTGLSPASCRTCTAYKKKPDSHRAVSLTLHIRYSPVSLQMLTPLPYMPPCGRYKGPVSP